MIQRLRRLFTTTVIGGIAVMLPIALIFFLFSFIWNFLSNLLSPMRGLLPFHENTATWMIDLISLAIVVIVFFMVGLIVQTQLGNNLVKMVEKTWLEQIPFYATIRDTVQQFFGNKKMPFSEVVLVDAFGNGTLMTGFLIEALGNDYFTVFVPTAPNPTNGFVFHVKSTQLHHVKAKTEDAIRSIIAVGAGSGKLFENFNNAGR